jgi:hypothetical protein
LSKLTVTCLSSQLLDRKLTMTNMSCTLANIHRSKVHVVERHITSACYTYVIKVLSIKVSKTTSTNIFSGGKTTLGITYKPFDTTKWIQMFSLAKNLLSHITLHLPKKQLGFHGLFKIGL